MVTHCSCVLLAIVVLAPIVCNTFSTISLFLFHFFLFTCMFSLSTDGDANEASPAQGRKRHGSHGHSHSHKPIKLELVYKSGGLEQKLILAPTSTNRKHSIDWLKALKKVSTLGFVLVMTQNISIVVKDFKLVLNVVWN